jgi:TRAP-type C4-dicarboxylate transport system permease large subunit
LFFFRQPVYQFEPAAWMGGRPVSRYVVLVLILIVVGMLGCLVDSMAIVLLTVPVLYPMILNLGFDLIWFGILAVRIIEMGLITPPVGLNVYITQGITGESMGTIFRGVGPFIVADICEVILSISISQITLFLSGLMTG